MEPRNCSELGDSTSASPEKHHKLSIHFLCGWKKSLGSLSLSLTPRAKGAEERTTQDRHQHVLGIKYY